MFGTVDYFVILPTTMIVDLNEFMSRFSNEEEVLYFPNKGNAGDALIHVSEVEIMKSHKIKFRCVKYPPFPTITEGILFYGGGGNLNDLYHDCANFLLKYSNPSLKNQIFVLPQSVFGLEKLLQTLSSNVTIICREVQSYDHVMGNATLGINVLLSHDAAFYFNALPKLETDFNKVLNAFRTDRERLDSKKKLPSDNVDVSLLFRVSDVFGPKREQCALEFLQYLKSKKHVRTDRLHVAIACGLMRVKTDFYPNSYWKNEAVYKHSFSKFNLTDWVTFHHET